MNYSDVSRLLLLVLLVMLTQSDSSELPSRTHNDHPRLTDVKPFAVALTPPPHSLPPDVARLEAQGSADAAAIRQKEAKKRQKLWHKEKQTSVKHKQQHPQTNTEQHKQEDLEKKTEMEKKQEGMNKMGQQKEHGQHGNKKSQDSSKVKQYSVHRY